MRQTALNMVYDLAKSDPRVVFIGSDLGVGVLQEMKEKMPHRFFMEGISEALVVGMAAGMAMEGKIPYINTIATFLSRRCFEQVVLDACLHKLPLRLIASGGGLVYAPLGPTHLAIDDIAIFRPIPNMTIVAPSDANEMKRLMRQTLDWPGPMYIRLAKGGDPIVSSDALPFQIGKAIEVQSGKDVLLVTTGVTLGIAKDAATQLAGQGVSVGILHLHTIKPFDCDAFLAAARDARVIVTIEEGTAIGGLGSASAEVLCEAGVHPRGGFRRIGIGDAFPDRYGSQDALMKHCGISPEHILQVVRELLRAH